MSKVQTIRNNIDACIIMKVKKKGNFQPEIKQDQKINSTLKVNLVNGGH
jgi:hypothetical protein